MKKIILLSALLYNYALLTDPGCMDNSYHLTKHNDPKNLHHVQCNCPCEKQYTMLANGTCSKCRHFHDPRNSVISIEQGAVNCSIKPQIISQNVAACQCYPKKLFKCR